MMQSVFEKIIEKLEEEKMFYFLTIANTGDEKLDYAYEKVGNALDKSIEIVKQAEAEYNGGWIPCSERLPEEDKDVLVIMSDESMMVDYRTASSSGWFWADRDDMPIAWQPLPEPYKPEMSKKG